MPSKKKYTNVYFTKRVDHEEGHQIDKKMSEPAVCSVCGAFYTKGRWTFEKVFEKEKSTDLKIELRETICSACLQVKEGVPAGFVYIKGKFFKEHKEEIENLLRNEAAKSSETNPLARIMDWKEAKTKLTVTTTTEHLAQHLGRALQRAYNGDVRYDFSHENKLARVYWQRDQ